MTAEKINRLLYNEYRLLVVSGISGDKRELIVSKKEAIEAIDLFCYRLFLRICLCLEWLGIQLDDEH